MIKKFMDDLMWGGVRAFFITFGIGILILILVLSLMGCKSVERQLGNPDSVTVGAIEVLIAASVAAGK